MQRRSSGRFDMSVLLLLGDQQTSERSFRHCPIFGGGSSDQPGFLLLDHPNNLRLGETALSHSSAPSGLGRLYIRLRAFPGGQVTTCPPVPLNGYCAAFDYRIGKDAGNLVDDLIQATTKVQPML